MLIFKVKELYTQSFSTRVHWVPECLRTQVKTTQRSHSDNRFWLNCALIWKAVTEMLLADSKQNSQHVREQTVWIFSFFMTFCLLCKNSSSSKLRIPSVSKRFFVTKNDRMAVSGYLFAGLCAYFLIEVHTWNLLENIFIAFQT